MSLFKAYVTSLMRTVDDDLVARVPTEIPSGMLCNPSFFDPNGVDKLLYARTIIRSSDNLAEFADNHPSEPPLESPTFLSAADRGT